MAKVDVICADCDQVTEVVMDVMGAAEFQVNTSDPEHPYTEEEWAEITHHLEVWEVRVLREKLCRDCQGAPVDWYDLPGWVKNDLGHASRPLPFYHGCHWWAVKGGAYAAYTELGVLVDTFSRE